MKLAPLLSQYLIANKRLDLPGIGRFKLSSTTVTDPDPAKQTISGDIHFENDPSIKESPDLVAYISSQTGKMKALANADLNSHLELAQQFLNIGKPFLFEGIGSLVKIKAGHFEFTAGQIISEKVKEYSVKEISATSSTEDSFTDYQSVFYPPKLKIKWRKPAMVGLMIAGLLLAVWGGYTVYNKTKGKEKAAPAISKQEETVLIPDTTVHYQKDSVIENPPPITSTTQVVASVPAASNMPGGNYKFVIEEATRTRGLFRFGTLKGYGLNVQMETKDSVHFKLFFVLPAALSDTARMVDSLSVLYTPSWSKAFVEN